MQEKIIACVETKSCSTCPELEYLLAKTNLLLTGKNHPEPKLLLHNFIYKGCLDHRNLFSHMLKLPMWLALILYPE